MTERLSASDLHQQLTAAEAEMREALGLTTAVPEPPKPVCKDGLKFRQQAEVALRCVTRDKRVITFHHTEKTISLLEAVCHANQHARRFGLRVLWVEESAIKERPYEIPR